MKAFGENSTDEECCCCTMWRVDLAKTINFHAAENVSLRLGVQ